jgi:hypothetical protein
MNRLVIVTALLALVSCSGGQDRAPESIDELLQVIEQQRLAASVSGRPPGFAGEALRV